MNVFRTFWNWKSFICNISSYLSCHLLTQERNNYDVSDPYTIEMYSRYHKFQKIYYDYVVKLMPNKEVAIPSARQASVFQLLTKWVQGSCVVKDMPKSSPEIKIIIHNVDFIKNE